jgi:hypothetical protein
MGKGREKNFENEGRILRGRGRREKDLSRSAPRTLLIVINYLWEMSTKFERPVAKGKVLRAAHSF